jgi:predicted RNA-binding protein with PUA-like domain
MKFWLMKSEPDVFSFDDLMARPGKTEPWDGVRNYLARNHMMAMKRGDLILIYHSNCEPPHVAGIATVAKEAYPDSSAWDPASDYFDPKSPAEKPRWFRVDVKGVKALKEPVALATLKGDSALEGLEVVRKGTRLSVTPVTEEEFVRVLLLGNTKYSTK